MTLLPRAAFTLLCFLTSKVPTQLSRSCLRQFHRKKDNQFNLQLKYNVGYHLINPHNKLTAGRRRRTRACHLQA